MILPGTKVQCGVYVMGEFRPTYIGKVVSVESGYYKVDIMSLHGGAPWVVTYSCGEVRELV
jgi:hypothetical protein